MKRLLIAALALTATMSQAATYGWTVVDLGALGPTGSVPTSINNNGDVTGYSRSAASTDGTPYHGFLYRNGAMYDLGKPAGSAFAQVMAMNDAGTLAATDERGNGHLWKDGTWIPLNFHGKPKAVNRVDMVVGTFPLGAGERAFLWASGMATELGTLGGTKSRGNSVNDRGIVVGSATIAGDGTSHAFLYDDGGMKDLGTLGGTYSSANDINNFGVVVGGAYNAQNKMTAFVYDSSGMRALFNAGDTSSATAINDRGAVVGLIDEGGFLYDNGVLTRLEQLPEVKAAGFSAIFPAGINERGWITAWGWHADGKPGSAVLLIPPPVQKMMWRR
jgi:probable HAF family extracellular repeat protein